MTLIINLSDSVVDNLQDAGFLAKSAQYHLINSLGCDSIVSNLVFESINYQLQCWNSSI